MDLALALDHTFSLDEMVSLLALLPFILKSTLLHVIIYLRVPSLPSSPIYSWGNDIKK